jgi:hypothetical protein
MTRKQACRELKVLETELDANLLTWLARRASGSASRRLRAAGAVTAACTALNADVVAVRSSFRRLRIACKLDYRPDLGGLPYEGFITVAEQHRTPSALQQRWQEVLRVELGNSKLAAALQGCAELFVGWDDDALVTLVRQLRELELTGPAARSRFTFGVSARVLMGSSKLLDRLPSAARELLGVSKLPSTPRYVVAAGPSRPTTVLLIENSTTFEEAVQAGYARDVTLVAAYGYGLNMNMSGSSGWALVESLISGGCGVLSREGFGHDLGSLLNCPNLLYWGDLDREGLRIALALRARLPALRLSALYLPLLAQATRPGGGHPYSECTGKADQRGWAECGDTLVDAVAAHCASTAVDQEAVYLESSSQLVHRALRWTARGPALE